MKLKCTLFRELLKVYIRQSIKCTNSEKSQVSTLSEMARKWVKSVLRWLTSISLITTHLVGLGLWMRQFSMFSTFFNKTKINVEEKLKPREIWKFSWPCLRNTLKGKVTQILWRTCKRVEDELRILCSSWCGVKGERWWLNMQWLITALAATSKVSTFYSQVGYTYIYVCLFGRPLQGKPVYNLHFNYVIFSCPGKKRQKKRDKNAKTKRVLVSLTFLVFPIVKIMLYQS